MNITAKEFADAIADAYARGYKDGQGTKSISVPPTTPMPWTPYKPHDPWLHAVITCDTKESGGTIINMSCTCESC